MDLKQFKEKRLRTEDGEHIYLDVRPFGEQEGDAIAFCLRETLERERQVSTPASKKIVLIYEPTSKILSRVLCRFVFRLKAWHRILSARRHH